ncbi:MAG: hypothetical protein JXJ18_08355 [Rhodobacteraceae bacterium]|nr:hypothetical protein [Paracoccaceae bacterium]
MNQHLLPNHAHAQKARSAAALAALHFVFVHICDLWEIFELVEEAGDTRGRDALIELSGLEMPPPETIRVKIDALRDVLADVPFEKLEQLSIQGDAPLELSARVDWHGARISELATRLALV